MERYGTEYGFFYPKELTGLTSDSVIYCVGAGEDISQDVSGLAKQLGSNVHIFDPTPRAIDHVKYVQVVFVVMRAQLLMYVLGVVILTTLIS